MGRYSKKAEQTIETAMQKFKQGKLTIGKNGPRVKSRKQAIAIGLSEARKKATGVPSVS